MLAKVDDSKSNANVNSNYLNVDPRDGSRELLKPLLDIGVRAQLTGLDFGDFNFVGYHPFTREEVLIGIERKVIDDFIHSMTSNRLTKQAYGMSEMYPFRYVLIEGNYRSDDDGNLLISTWNNLDKVKQRDDGSFMETRNWKYYRFGGMRGGRPMSYGKFQSYLYSLQNIAGLDLIRTEDIKDTAYALRYLWQWWQKTEHTSLGIEGFGDVDVTASPLGLSMGRTLFKTYVHKIPGIGEKRILPIVNHFRSIGKMVIATPEQWAQIPGIGLSTARRIVDEFWRESATNGGKESGGNNTSE